MPRTQQEFTRLMELAGIKNSPTQLIDAAAAIAERQLEAAREIAGKSKGAKGYDQDVIAIAQIIATNMAVVDVISKK